MGFYKSVHRLSTPHDLSHKSKQRESETDIFQRKHMIIDQNEFGISAKKTYSPPPNVDVNANVP